MALSRPDNSDYARAVRPVYLAAIVVVALECGWMLFGGMDAILAGVDTPPEMFLAGRLFAVISFLGVAGVFAGLAAWPRWWSKLVLFWPGIGWTMFAFANSIGGVGLDVTWPAVAGGAAMVALAVVSQIVEWLHKARTTKA